jgi:hypothetical protein
MCTGAMDGNVPALDCSFINNNDWYNINTTVIEYAILEKEVEGEDYAGGFAAGGWYKLTQAGWEDLFNNFTYNIPDNQNLPKKGFKETYICTQACNYDATAIIDDGSCWGVVDSSLWNGGYDVTPCSCSAGEGAWRAYNAADGQCDMCCNNGQNECYNCDCQTYPSYQGQSSLEGQDNAAYSCAGGGECPDGETDCWGVCGGDAEEDENCAGRYVNEGNEASSRLKQILPIPNQNYTSRMMIVIM